MDQRPAFPPPTARAGEGDEDSAPIETRLAHPVSLAAVAAALGLLITAVVGGAVFAIVYFATATSCSPNDGWCELGAAVLGLLISIILGAIAYVIVGVVTIFRCRPAGRRAAHIAIHIAIPFVLTIALGATSNL